MPRRALCYVGGGRIDTSLFFASKHKVFTKLLLDRVWGGCGHVKKVQFVKNAFACLSEMVQMVRILM